MKFWTDNFFTQHIIPGRYGAVIEKDLLKEFEMIESVNNYDLPTGDTKKILEKIEKDLEGQLDRKKGLEDKIKAILFSITVSMTAITFTLDHDLILGTTTVTVITSLVLLFSIFYFLSSALLAVKALIPAPFGTLYENIIFDKNRSEISLKFTGNEDRLKELVKKSLLNDNANLRLANSTYACLKLLRNGLILFAIYFALALTQKTVKSKPIPFTPYRYALTIT